MRNGRGQFTRGHKTWNKNRKGLMPTPWNKGKNFPQFSRENSTSFKHGMSHTRFNTIWKHMRSRCLKPKDGDYKNYGTKGIKVCERWDEFRNFRDDMYETYLEHTKDFGERETTIERKDSKGDYSPENCTWATKRQQSQNRGFVTLYVFNGEEKTLGDWGKEKNLDYHTLYARVVKKKWPIEKALNAPKMKNQFG